MVYVTFRLEVATRLRDIPRVLILYNIAPNQTRGLKRQLLGMSYVTEIFMSNIEGIYPLERPGTDIVGSL